MLQFIIGIFVGGIFGFAICAICAVAGRNERTNIKPSKKIGEDNAPSK